MNWLLVVGILLMALGTGILLGCLAVHLTKPKISDEQRKAIHEAVERIFQETKDKRV